MPASPRRGVHQGRRVVRAVQFELTEEQRAIRDMVREFAAKEIIPVAAKHDREHSFPRATTQRMADLGLLGITVPPEYGGPGADYVSFALVAEELARADAS